MVYHYTTIDTFYSMLANYKDSKDKKNLDFWASSILHQNDKEELSISATDIMPVVKEIERSTKMKGLTDLQKLSTVNEQWWVPTLTGQKVKEDINEFFQNKYNIPYTISFSQKEDSLLMWTMYANSGNGICLAFDERMLINRQTYKYVIPDFVQYKKAPQNYKEIIEFYYDMYIKELGDEYIINIIYNLKRKYWESMLMGLSPFFKNKAFEDEAEYRIVYFVESDKNPPVYTRLTSHLNVIKYIKAKITLDALQYVIIGPCANYKKTKDLLVENMKSCEIEQVYNKRFIRKSHIPYRLY